MSSFLTWIKNFKSFCISFFTVISFNDEVKLAVAPCGSSEKNC